MHSFSAKSLIEFAAHALGITALDAHMTLRDQGDAGGRGMRIELLGGFAVVVAGQRVDPKLLKLRRARAMIAMLALAPRQRLRRDSVIDELWPKLDPEAGVHGLHQAMYIARRALAKYDVSGCLTVQQHDVVLWENHVPVDALEFERIAQAALADSDQEALTAALAAYTGELLPDLLDIEWLAEWRLALSATHQAVTLRLAEISERSGDYEQALALFERIVAADPMQEAAVRGVMTVLIRCDRQSEAIARYNAFRSMLAETLGTDPSAQTRALFQRALADADSTVTVRSVRLPMAQNSFVGRDRELEQVRGLLQRSRLVTLVGAGGAGKTRLAIELARRPGIEVERVRFVALSGLTEPGRLADEVAGQLGLTPSAGREPVRALTEQVGHSQIMIVLDNCEHLLAPCARLVTALIEGCPNTAILATSREPLRAGAERTFRVPSLEVPEPLPVNDAVDVPSLARVASISLFVERARQSRSDFSLGPGNAVAVADVCRRLDGMPLALELAAARVALMEPAEILERLDDVLATVARRQPGISRHETLRAALVWSFELLSEAEKCLLRRLSVFVAGFTLDAAEAVCEAAPLAHSEILSLLGSLVDKSLVDAVHSGRRTRYRLLETVRQFCAQQLALMGGEPLIAAKHCEHYLRMARAHEADTFPGVVQDGYTDLDVEHDNFRAALRWSLTADPSRALELAASLWRYWFLRCHVVEGAEWVERALDAADGPVWARAEALIGLTGLNARRGRSHLIRAQSAAAIAAAEHTFDAPTLAIYRLAHATVVWATSDVQEAELIARSVREAAEAAGRWDLLAGASWVLAQCALTREDPTAAGELLDRCFAELQGAEPDGRAFLPVVTPCSVVVPAGGRRVPTYEESHFVGRRAGAAQSVGFVLAAMGYVHRQRGDLPMARFVVGRAVSHFTALADHLGRAQALNQLGCILRDLGDFDSGIECLDEARHIRRELGDRRGEWLTTMNMSLLDAKKGDAAQGRRAAMDCLAAFQAVDDRPSVANAWAAIGNTEVVCGNVSAALEMYERALAEFRSQSWPRVEAWHCLVVAELAIELGNRLKAGSALERASKLLSRQRCITAQGRLTTLRNQLGEPQSAPEQT
jgi:predicted ATPase/DNA-binding SARP family transcriptional activator